MQDFVVGFFVAGAKVVWLRAEQHGWNACKCPQAHRRSGKGSKNVRARHVTRSLEFPKVGFKRDIMTELDRNGNSIDNYFR